MDKKTAPTPPVLTFAAAIAPATQDQPRRFTGIAYSGEVIPDHWAWGDVVFDLASMILPEKAPVLIEHDRHQRAGVIDTFSVSDDTGLTVSGYLMDNEAGRAVATEADAGFPWQMSVHIEPARIDRTIRAIINGRVIDGQTTVFVGGSIREVSFTPTGADKNTSAQVFNHQPAPIEDHAMTVEELQAQVKTLQAENADLKAAFAARVLDERAEKFAAAMGEAPTDEEKSAIAGMTEAQFALLLKKPAAPKADASLFSEQANRGAAPSSMPLADYIKSTLNA